MASSINQHCVRRVDSLSLPIGGCMSNDLICYLLYLNVSTSDYSCLIVDFEVSFERIEMAILFDLSVCINYIKGVRLVVKYVNCSITSFDINMHKD